jgi:DNA primase
MSNFRIHPDTVEAVKQRLDIYDIIAEHIVLKKRGKNFVGLCPFHDEKTPSFTVSPAKQMYYCFGCGNGGNGIKFLMELGKESFSEVVLGLAKRYQIQVKTESAAETQEIQQQISRREKLYEILSLATSFYQHALKQPAGKIAWDYLIEKRRFSEETIQKFQLGYSPAGWDSLYDYLVEQKRYPAELLEQAGLIVPRKTSSGFYDRFRNRLMIPIHDVQGRVIGFGGRTLSDEEPKYLNSPETELFDKGKTLFALHEAKGAIAKLDQAVIVEGYFDAIALHAAGINQVVACLGTAFSVTQLRVLLKYTESARIIFNFDADVAGVKATDRAISEIEELAYRGDVQLRVLNLPGGKDADEFLQQYSPDAYKELLNQAVLWIDWKIQQIMRDKNLKQADDYGEVTKNLVKLLTNIKSDNLLTHYLQVAAEYLGQSDNRRIPLISENLLTQVMQQWQQILRQDASIAPPLFIANQLQAGSQTKFQKAKARKPAKKLDKFSTNNPTLLAETESLLLRIYLHRPEARQEIKNGFEARDLYFSLSPYRFLWRQILSLEDRLVTEVNTIEKIDLITLLQDIYVEYPEQLSQINHLFHLDELTEKNILRSPLQIRAAIAVLELIMCEKRRLVAINKWKETSITTQPELAQQYQEQLYNEELWIKELKKLRLVIFGDLIMVPLEG